MTDIYMEILSERKAQDAKWGEQNHPMILLTPAVDLGVIQSQVEVKREICNTFFPAGIGTWKHILDEEVWEAYEQAALGNQEELRKELIQVAAVVVAMIESLDRNGL